MKTSERLDDVDLQGEAPLPRARDEGWDESVLVWNGMVASLPAPVPLVDNDARGGEPGARARPRELAFEYEVAHTTLGRYFERPEVRKQLTRPPRSSCAQPPPLRH